MSYLVLARKWRPQGFEDVIGQDHVTRTLKNAIKSGRVAHALIFSGPRGVGKTSIARILAKALNCIKGPTPSPCNSCEICAEITSGYCVDVNEIDGASNRGIDEIRQLKEEIRFQPVVARYRIYIIDEVHMLTNEAFNALLKTLEEPPPHAYFIFATTEPRKIPETIHSRCQHFEFKRLTEDDLSRHLLNITHKEGFDFTEEAISIIARQARGSVRDSLSLLDQVIAYGARTYEEICEVLGVVGPSTLEELSISVLSGDVKKVLSLIAQLYSMGVDLQGLANDLLKFLRDISIIKKLPEKDAKDLTKFDEKRIKVLKEAFSSFSELHILSAMNKLSSSMEELNRTLDPRLSLEIILLQICSQPSFATIDDLIKKLDDIIELYEGEREEAGALNKDPFKPKKQIQLNKVSKENKEINDIWKKFVEYVKAQKPQLGSLLDACKEVKKGENGNFVVTCTQDFKGQMLCDREKTKELSLLANSFFNGNINFCFELEKLEDNDNKLNTTNVSSVMGQREELIQNPLVQSAINIFQARISNVTLYNKYKNRKGNKS